MPKKKTKVKNSFLSSAVGNGLSEAIMGFNPGGIGTQVVQSDTQFRNLRWYLVSNMRQLLSQLYAERGLVSTLCDLPVDDALRGGYTIKTKQLTTDQIEELEQEIESEQINGEIVGQALKWMRLYGGAGILVMTDQDPATPLDINAIGPDSPLEFRAVDMWELFWDKQNTGAYDAALQEHEVEFYSYYGVKTHKSRVMKMKGIIPPSFIRPRLRGWGLSVVEALISSINQYMKNNELVFEVLDEFKLDIFKIRGLTQTLVSADGTAKIQQRLQLANRQKNFQNALTMDAEDDYVQKQLTFSGLAEMFKEFRVQIASDMRIPMTKLFGLSASGFNSGEDDIEVYNGMVEGQVRARCRREIIQILQLKAQKKFGVMPTDLSIEFESMRVLSSEQQEKVKTEKMNRILGAISKGLCTAKEAKESINKHDLLGIQVDVDAEPELPTQEEPKDENLRRTE